MLNFHNIYFAISSLRPTTAAACRGILWSPGALVAISQVRFAYAYIASMIRNNSTKMFLEAQLLQHKILQPQQQVQRCLDHMGLRTDDAGTVCYEECDVIRYNG